MKKEKLLSSHSKRQNAVELAKSKNIIDVAISLGMGLDRSGKNFTWDQHDSFMFDTRKNYFYWNSQRFGGGPIQLVKAIKNVSFKEAVNYLNGTDIKVAKLDNTEPKKFSYFLNDHKSFTLARKYLHDKRSISNETIDFLLSQGALAQSSYTEYKTNKSQPVIVFKSLDSENKIKGFSVQGVWKQKKEKRPYLKKTHGDGFSGFTVRVGQPPVGNQISEKKPLKIIAFEAPIDLISYYELFKKDIGDAILVSMNGLKKGAISKLLANQLEADIKENEKPDFLDTISKKMKPNDLIQIVLAVDNDKAGKKFIRNFDVSNIKVTSDIPQLLEGENKSDWNQVLQRLKKLDKQQSKKSMAQTIQPHKVDEGKRGKISPKLTIKNDRRPIMNKNKFQEEYTDALASYVSDINKMIETNTTNQKDKSKLDLKPKEPVLTRSEVEKMLDNHFSKIEQLIAKQEKEIEVLSVDTPIVEVEKKSTKFLSELKIALVEFKDTIKYLIGNTTDDIRLGIKNGINKRILRINLSIKNLGNKIDQKFAIEEKVQRADPREVNKQASNSQVKEEINEKNVENSESISNLHQSLGKTVPVDLSKANYFFTEGNTNIKQGDKTSNQKNQTEPKEIQYDFNKVSKLSFMKRAAKPEHNWQAHQNEFGDTNLDKAWEVFIKDTWEIQNELVPEGRSDLISTWEKDYYNFFYEGGKESYDNALENGTPIKYTTEALQEFENLYDQHIAEVMKERLSKEVTPAQSLKKIDEIQATESIPQEKTIKEEQKVVDLPKQNKFEQRVTAAKEQNKIIEKNLMQSEEKIVANDGPVMG